MNNKLTIEDLETLLNLRGELEQAVAMNNIFNSNFSRITRQKAIDKYFECHTTFVKKFIKG
jgi:hypothetical protein